MRRISVLALAVFVCVAVLSASQAAGNQLSGFYEHGSYVFEFSGNNFILRHPSGIQEGTYYVTNNEIEFVFSTGRIVVYDFSRTPNTIMIGRTRYTRTTAEAVAEAETRRRHEAAAAEVRRREAEQAETRRREEAQAEARRLYYEARTIVEALWSAMSMVRHYYHVDGTRTRSRSSRMSLRDTFINNPETINTIIGQSRLLQQYRFVTRSGRPGEILLGIDISGKPAEVRRTLAQREHVRGTLNASGAPFSGGNVIYIPLQL